MAVRGLGNLVASGCRGMVGEVMHLAVVADGGQDGEVAGALTAMVVMDVSSARMEVEISWSGWLTLAMLEGGGQGGAVEDTGERSYGWRLGFGCKENWQRCGW